MKQLDTPADVITANKESEDARKALARREFAQEAKRLRERAKLSQESMAIKIGIEQGIISRIELGRYGITLDLILTYANFFNEDPHRLADVYWGNSSNISSDANKQVLDSLWDILSKYYQPRLSTTQPKPDLPASYLAAADAIGHELADKAKKKKVEPDNKETDETDEENTQKS
jgi:transcriptional regulator with XRE-family HTH domain